MNQTQTVNERYTRHLEAREYPIMTYPATTFEGEKIVEVGPGRGDFLFHLAKENPEDVVYGIEIKDKRFKKLIQRRDTRELNNIQLVLADANIALPELFGPNSISKLYINFPDPWPKKKHAKNRLLKEDFLRRCVSALKPNGMLFITTDVEWYAHDTYDICRSIEELDKSEFSINESEEGYPTFFYEKWVKEGRNIHYQKHIKRSEL